MTSRIPMSRLASRGAALAALVFLFSSAVTAPLFAQSATGAIQGARINGAAQIIAVDPVALKREKAQELGATHAVETMEEATELAKQFTNGQGADQTIITVGIIKPEYVGQAMASIRKAGTVVVTALGNIADTTPLPISMADISFDGTRRS